MTRLSARAAIASLADPGSFVELPVPPRESPADGPLAWSGYDDSRARAELRTGERESVVTGTVRIGGHEATLISFEFGFLGGRWASAPETGSKPRTAMLARTGSPWCP